MRRSREDLDDIAHDIRSEAAAERQAETAAIIEARCSCEHGAAKHDTEFCEDERGRGWSVEVVCRAAGCECYEYGRV